MWLVLLAPSAIAAPGQASWVYPGAQPLDAGEGWVAGAAFVLPAIGVGTGVLGMAAATDTLAFQVGVLGAWDTYGDGASAMALAGRWVAFDERPVRLGIMGGFARVVNQYDDTLGMAMTGVVLEAGGVHFLFDASIPFTMTEQVGDGDVTVVLPFQAAETVPAFGFTHRFDEHHRLRLGGLVPTLTYQYASQRFFLDAGVVVIAPLVRTGWRF
jgi:hypothetical protein